MARTPKPPKLNHGGLNVFQRLILGAYFTFFGVIFLLPSVFTYVFDLNDVQPTFDDLLPWLMLGGIALVAFLAVTPEFWQAVVPAIGQSLTGLIETNDFTSTFWMNFKEGALFRETLWTIFAFAALGMVAFFIGFEVVMGMPIGKAPDQFAEGFINSVFIGVLILSILVHTISAVKATKADLAEHPQSNNQTPDYRDFIKAGGQAETTETVSDDDFSFDPNAFTESRSRAKPSKGSARKPAGQSDKAKTGTRHPDDTALWEVVNDENSTSEERKTALEIIMEREAGRK